MIDEPPHAVIRQTGKWQHTITIHHGLIVRGPGGGGCVYGWTRWGRERAEKKARKELARYIADRERRAARWEVAAGEVAAGRRR